MEPLDRTTLNDLVAWMRGVGVLVYETDAVKLALGPAPQAPPPPVILPTFEEEHRMLWAEALEKAEDYARKQYPGRALSAPDIATLATTLTGVRPCT